MKLFYAIVLLHLLYDFHWQGAFIAEWKYKSKFILFIHSLTYGMLLAAPIYYLRPSMEYVTESALLITFTHYVIDNWKCQYPNDPKYFWTLYVDQAAHLAVISFICAVLYGK